MCGRVGVFCCFSALCRRGGGFAVALRKGSQTRWLPLRFLTGTSLKEEAGGKEAGKHSLNGQNRRDTYLEAGQVCQRKTNGKRGNDLNPTKHKKRGRTPETGHTGRARGPGLSLEPDVRAVYHAPGREQALAAERIRTT